ncbi:MAG: large conductance mechanosensitive channel protein MscL [Chloroflexia bacterium]
MADTTDQAPAGGAAPGADDLRDKLQEKAGEGGEGSGEKPKSLKEFLFRGNVFDLATAVIIGVAFGAVVSSLVNDIIMPPIGALLGGIDFTSLFINLSDKAYPNIAAAKAAGAATINYGLFINAVITFLIVGTVLYLIVISVGRMTTQSKASTPEVTTKVCQYCISNIPRQATRCPNCTSQLEGGVSPAGRQTI